MTKYNLLLRMIHWTMGLLIMGLIIIGFNMGKADDAMKPFLYGIHKATGITMLGLVILRVITRISTKTPPMLNNSLMNYVARIVHWCLYSLMFLMPISGYVMSSASGRGIKWFFDIQIPLLVDENLELASFAHKAHGVLAYAIVGFISLHLLGTLKHLIIDRYNILRRIW